MGKAHKNCIIDDFRGACAVKRNVPVAGHVVTSSVSTAETFSRVLFRKETLTGHYFIFKFDLSLGIRTNMGKLREFFPICNVIVTE